MQTPSVTVLKRGALRVQSGHPWIYRSDVKDPGPLPGGSAVRVVDERGMFLATAFFSARSQITLRLLSREDRPADDLLVERLKLAVDLRRRLFPEASAVRLVHGEGDLLPGLVVDRYGDALSLQTLTGATEQRSEIIIRTLVELTGAKVVVLRNDVSARKHEGLPLEKRVAVGRLDGPVTYQEGRITLTADLMEGQKTGAFLDQRENHVIAGELAHGRALDCFSYMGGFALQLALKAESVVAVDSSEHAVSLIAANAARNSLTNVEPLAVNAFDYLRARVEAKDAFDTIVLDPPAFTKSRDAIEAAMRGYKEINLRAMRLLRPGGLLVSASCSYHVDEGMFAEMLLAASRDAGRPMQLIEKRGAGRDHPELVGAPETKYLKCFFLRAL
ncbi:MAG: hypothetical protein RL199_457 [Pseudomonadota bacterium]|jgi:23S rRNA (cytosine1962-C5)-methyltransferase